MSPSAPGRTSRPASRRSSYAAVAISSTKIGSFGGVSLTALMEPPMFGFMEPLTGADLGSRTG